MLFLFYVTMWLLLTIAFVLCVALNEAKERTASLVVLPPLVLGYEDLYYDNPQLQLHTKGDGAKTTTKDNGTSTDVGTESTTNDEGIEATSKDDAPPSYITNEDMDVVLDENMDDNIDNKNMDEFAKRGLHKRNVVMGEIKEKENSAQDEKVKKLVPYSKKRGDYSYIKQAYQHNQIKAVRRPVSAVKSVVKRKFKVDRPITNIFNKKTRVHLPFLRKFDEETMEKSYEKEGEVVNARQRVTFDELINDKSDSAAKSASDTV